MWKWIEFSFRVLGGYLTAMVILAVSATVATIVVFAIVNLVQLLFW